MTTPNRALGEADHLWPQMLPDGRHVLYTVSSVTGDAGNAQVAVANVQSGESRVVLRGASHARYLPTGHLIYLAVGSLQAVPFDLATVDASGQAIPVLPGITVATDVTGAVHMDVSRDGTLAYIAGSQTPASPRSLVWVSRDGRESPVGAPERAYLQARLSPYGTSAALVIGDDAADIWSWDFTREVLTKLTFDPGNDATPVWMPDGRLVYSSDRGGATNIYRRTPDGPDEPERLTQSSNQQRPSSVTPDGRSVVFTQHTALGDMRLLALPPAGGSPSRQMGDILSLVATPRSEGNGEVSPDGRWIAYQAADESHYEIFVSPFPDIETGRWKVSSRAASKPAWARDSGELFFLDDQSGDMMSVRVGRGSDWTSARPTRLFDARGYYQVWHRSHDVSADGTRFLMIKAAPADQVASANSIVVVQNWFEELKRLVPTR